MRQVEYSKYRHQYNTPDVARHWASGCAVGESRFIHSPGRRVFAEHGGIYSYGYHFPIAQGTLVNGRLVFFVTDRPAPSHTTRRHITRVVRAIHRVNGEIITLDPSSGGMGLWAIRHSPRDAALCAIVARWYQRRVDEAVQAGCKPRIREKTRVRCLETAVAYGRNWEKLVRWFGLNASQNDVSYPLSLAALRYAGERLKE